MGKLFGRPLGGDRPQPTEASMAAAAHNLGMILDNGDEFTDRFVGVLMRNNLPLPLRPEDYAAVSNGIADHENGLRVEVAALLYEKLTAMVRQQLDSNDPSDFFDEQVLMRPDQILKNDLFDHRKKWDSLEYTVNLALDMLSGRFDWEKALRGADPQILESEGQIKQEWPHMYAATQLLTARSLNQEGRTYLAGPVPV